MNRIEQDTMGTIEVPQEAYYGAQSARSLINFAIGDERFSQPFIEAFGILKKACAKANYDSNTMNKETYELINQAADDVNRYRNPGHDHGALRVFPGEVGRLQHLDQHIAGQAQRKPRQGPTSLSDILRIKTCTLKEPPNQRFMNHDHGYRGREGQQHGQLHTSQNTIRSLARATAAKAAGHFGQEHHAQGNSDYSQRKLVNPVGIIECRDGSLLE